MNLREKYRDIKKNEPNGEIWSLALGTLIIGKLNITLFFDPRSWGLGCSMFWAHKMIERAGIEYVAGIDFLCLRFQIWWMAA